MNENNKNYQQNYINIFRYIVSVIHQSITKLDKIDLYIIKKIQEANIHSKSLSKDYIIIKVNQEID